MRQHFKIVVFDVDGTLLDTSEGVLSSVKKTIAEFGFSKIKDEELMSFIGPPIQDSFSRVYGVKGDKLQEIATYFRDKYKNEDLLKAKPYEGIYDVFEKLKNTDIKTAIATYKRQDYAEKIMNYFGFNNYTNVIFGADHFNKLKKMDIIKKCLTITGVNDYSDALMIGDSDNDALGAKQIGTAFLGVTYGFGFKSVDEVNEYPNIGTAGSPQEIIDLLFGE